MESYKDIVIAESSQTEAQITEKTSRPYRVISGIFSGYEFSGHPVVIQNEVRIWDDGSDGISFPASNCINTKA